MPSRALSASIEPFRVAYIVCREIAAKHCHIERRRDGKQIFY